MTVTKCSPHVYIYSTFERVLRHKYVNQCLFRSFFLGIRYNGVTQSFFPVLTVWSTAAFNHVCIFTNTTLFTQCYFRNTRSKISCFWHLIDIMKNERKKLFYPNLIEQVNIYPRNHQNTYGFLIFPRGRKLTDAFRFA